MFSLFRLTILLLLFPVPAIPALASSVSPAPGPNLAGILFFKTDCVECLEVINEIIPTALDNSSSDRSILAVNNSLPDGGQLFLEFLMTRKIPPNATLPIFITQNEIWSGKEEISRNLNNLLRSQHDFFPPDHFPSKNLVANLLSPNPNQRYSTAFLITKNTRPKQQNWLDYFYSNYQKDPVGNGTAVIVLLGMIFSLAYIFKLFISRPADSQFALPSLYPVLCLIAMGIAIYLFMSGLMESELSCGPVGECNTVQQSKYAKLFGIIPVSLLGMFAYAACIVFWLAARFDVWSQKKLFVVSAWACSVIAVCFFVYLTFLEPFVIGATCIWCVTSATITTITALVATKPALAAIHS